MWTRTRIEKQFWAINQNQDDLDLFAEFDNSDTLIWTWRVSPWISWSFGGNPKLQNSCFQCNRVHQLSSPTRNISLLNTHWLGLYGWKALKCFVLWFENKTFCLQMLQIFFAISEHLEWSKHWESGKFLFKFVIADWTRAITPIEWLFLPCSLFLMLPRFASPINSPKVPKSVNWELDLITSSSCNKQGE